MTFSLNTIILEPLSKEKPKNAVILCHGYGGDGKDIAILARTNTLPKSVVRALSSANIPMVLKNNVSLFNDSSAKDLLKAAAIASDIKSERGWDKKISPKLYSFAKKLLEEKE